MYAQPGPFVAVTIFIPEFILRQGISKPMRRSSASCGTLPGMGLFMTTDGMVSWSDVGQGTQRRKLWENAMGFGLGSRRVAGWTVASMLICAPSWALAQGTADERQACTPDVFRLCGRYIPDADRIANCLQQAGPRLSPACYAVFYPQGSRPRNARAAKRYYPPPRVRDDDDDDDD